LTYEKSDKLDHYITLATKDLVSEHSSLFAAFVSYEENEVLVNTVPDIIVSTSLLFYDQEIKIDKKFYNIFCQNLRHSSAKRRPSINRSHHKFFKTKAKNSSSADFQLFLNEEVK
jgi:hypothetical protein